MPLRSILRVRTSAANCAPKRPACWPHKSLSFRGVRLALLKRQRMFARTPGLVADGRDMGTEVFPAAELKIYLTASAEERASRRYKELLAKGEDVSLPALVEQVRSRDESDMSRDASPLRAADGAIEIDYLGHVDSGSDRYSVEYPVC